MFQKIQLIFEKNALLSTKFAKFFCKRPLHGRFRFRIGIVFASSILAAYIPLTLLAQYLHVIPIPKIKIRRRKRGRKTLT